MPPTWSSAGRVITPSGVAPGGACLAARVSAGAGGLLHHRFTLAATPARDAGRRSALCCAFHRVSPSGRYPAPLPCGVPTFLGARGRRDCPIGVTILPVASAARGRGGHARARSPRGASSPAVVVSANPSVTAGARVGRPPGSRGVPAAARTRPLRPASPGPCDRCLGRPSAGSRAWFSHAWADTGSGAYDGMQQEARHARSSPRAGRRTGRQARLAEPEAGAEHGQAAVQPAAVHAAADHEAAAKRDEERAGVGEVRAARVPVVARRDERGADHDRGVSGTVTWPGKVDASAKKSRPRHGRSSTRASGEREPDHRRSPWARCGRCPGRTADRRTAARPACGWR